MRKTFQPPYSMIKNLINVNRILSEKIEPQMIEDYETAIKNLQEYLNMHGYKNYNSSLNQVLDHVISIIKELNNDISINLVVKKLIFLQFFIKWTCEHQLMTHKIQSALTNQIKMIIQEDLKNLSKPKNKSFMSLEKISTFFRQLSAPKRSSSKMRLQEFNGKQAVKDIIQNILQPYCSYLLKVLNEHQAYFSILKKQESIYSTQTIWKIINWNIILCKIVCNLHKIGRYFGEDFTGVWVHCCFMISQDESTYFDILKEHIQTQSAKWLPKLVIAKKYYQINKKNHKEQLVGLFTHEQLQQIINLKKQIDEAIKIKQEINFLYLSKFLIEWKSSFKKISSNVVKLCRQKNSSSDELLNLVSSLAKNKELSSIFGDQFKQKQSSINKHVGRNHSENKPLKSLGSIATSEEQPINEQKLQQLIKQTSIQSKVQPRRNNIFTEKRNRILGRT